METTVRPLVILIILIAFAGEACTGNSTKRADTALPGTWQLLTVLTIEGEDTLLTDYTSGVKGLKMLNDTHFAFFQHDLNQGRESDSLYVSGGGPYTYIDGIYTEHLEYCNFRVYESNTFEFELSVTGDTLVQRGTEELEEAGVSKYIIETYVRVD